MIKVKCAGCGKTIKAGDDWAGKQGKCPACGAVFTCPFPTTVVDTEPKRIQDKTRPAVQPSLPPAPIVIDTSPPPRTAAPQVTIEHRHKATGGAFRSGFGIALGCLTAGALFLVGGCVVLGMFTKNAIDAAHTSLIESTGGTADPKLIASSGAPQLLDKLVVKLARFYRDKDAFSLSPTIHLVVRNDTGRAIKRAYFHGVYQTPGRSLPWAEDDINYEPEGGMEPGEELEWHLAPGYASEFRNIDIHDDAKFVVTVTNIQFVK